MPCMHARESVQSAAARAATVSEIRTSVGFSTGRLRMCGWTTVNFPETVVHCVEICPSFSSPKLQRSIYVSFALIEIEGESGGK